MFSKKKKNHFHLYIFSSFFFCLFIETKRRIFFVENKGEKYIKIIELIVEFTFVIKIKRRD
jgi:hypothetical protein